jgi:hypothetical protein
MSLTDTRPLGLAALAVLEAEMLWNDAAALRDPTAPTKKTDYLAAQAAYEIEVLSRTTPGPV